MLMIRLSRMGKKKQPTYRIIISEKQKDPWGDYLEVLGFYNPRTNPSTLRIKKERVAYWMEKGAQVSDTIHNLFVQEAILSTPKRRIVRPKKKDDEQKPAAPAAAAPKEENEKPKQTEENQKQEAKPEKTPSSAEVTTKAEPEDKKEEEKKPE